MNQIPYNMSGLTEAYNPGVCHSSEEDIERSGDSAQPLSDVKPLRVLTINHARELAYLRATGG